MDTNQTLHQLSLRADDIAEEMKQLMADEHLCGGRHSAEISRLQGALEVTVLFIRGVRMSLQFSD